MRSKAAAFDQGKNRDGDRATHVFSERPPPLCKYFSLPAVPKLHGGTPSRSASRPFFAKARTRLYHKNGVRKDQGYKYPPPDQQNVYCAAHNNLTARVSCFIVGYSRDLASACSLGTYIPPCLAQEESRRDTNNAHGSRYPGERERALIGGKSKPPLLNIFGLHLVV